MARGLSYNKEVAARHRAGTRQAAAGNLEAAVVELSEARRMCLSYEYISDRVGLAHELIIRRDLAGVDVRLSIMKVRRNLYIGPQQTLELRALSSGLANIYEQLEELAFTTSHLGDQAHLHSETALARIWRGRIALSQSILQSSPELRTSHRNSATMHLMRAEEHAFAGNNMYYRTLLLGNLARCNVLAGDSPAPYLRKAELTVVKSGFADPANFGRALLAVSDFSGESTPSKIESSIRSDKL